MVHRKWSWVCVARMVFSLDYSMGNRVFRTIPSGSFAYVAINTGNTIQVIDTSSNTIVGSIHVNPDPIGIAITPDGNFVYIGDGSVISTSSNTVVDTIPAMSLGEQPVDVAITPDGSLIYMPINATDTIKVIDASSNTVIHTINVGDGPAGVAIFHSQSKLNVYGTAKKDIFLSQTDLFNTIHWSSPTNTTPPIQYRISRNSQLISIIPASGSLVFEDHNLKKNQTITYVIVAEDVSGPISQGKITLKTKS